MSVQDIVEAYETRLRERWTPDGERINDPKNMYVMVTPSGEQVSSPFDITKPLLIPLDMDNVNGRLSDLQAINTREICGND